MAEGLGLKSFCGLAFQESMGVVQTTSVHWARMLSNGIAEDIGVLEGQRLQGRYNEGLARQGQRTIAGDLVFEPDMHTLAACLHAVLGVTATTSATNSAVHAITETASAFHPKYAVQPFAALCGYDVGTGFTFYNLAANQLTLDFAAGEFVKATLNCIGGYASHNAEYTTAFPASPIAEAADWSTVSLSLAGTAVDFVSQMQITLMNNLVHRPTLDATPYPGRVKREGFRQARFTATLEFEDLGEYTKWRAETTQTMALHFTRGLDTATLYAGRMRYDSFPMTPDGPGPINISVSGRFEHNSSSGDAFQASILTWSYGMDSVGNGTVV